jgi:hypothetical protein
LILSVLSLHPSVQLNSILPSDSFLPETPRSLVGNGSVPPPAISRPVLPLIGRRAAKLTSTSPLPRTRKPFQNPLRLLFNPDILILLNFNGLVCAVFYAVSASIATTFHETYPILSQTQLGLCYLGVLIFFLSSTQFSVLL